MKIARIIVGAYRVTTFPMTFNTDNLTTVIEEFAVVIFGELRDDQFEKSKVKMLPHKLGPKSYHRFS